MFVCLYVGSGCCGEQTQTPCCLCLYVGSGCCGEQTQTLCCLCLCIGSGTAVHIFFSCRVNTQTSFTACEKIKNGSESYKKKKKSHVNSVQIVFVTQPISRSSHIPELFRSYSTYHCCAVKS